jgi:ABC-type uncharacterized transport system permease subunit
MNSVAPDSAKLGGTFTERSGAAELGFAGMVLASAVRGKVAAELGAGAEEASEIFPAAVLPAGAEALAADAGAGGADAIVLGVSSSELAGLSPLDLLRFGKGLKLSKLIRPMLV